MTRIDKKAIYNRFGIDYRPKNHGQILSPDGNWVPCLLVDGNGKIGKTVFHFSTLPTNKDFETVINGKTVTVKGTCPCHCNGCYATKGNYRFPDNVASLAMRTLIARNHIDFMVKAVIAQINADNIRTLRIHASGDFFNEEYIKAWKQIAIACPHCQMWTYTKYRPAESAFDDIPNVNIVKSVIPGIGFNFGHCDYLMNAYAELIARGESVHICKCGFDKNQHCINCRGCIEHKYVLFLEHSTGYKAEKDPLYPAMRDMVMSQTE